MSKGWVTDGILDTLILPYVNADCMQVFLDEVASRHPVDRIILVLDGAGWHKAKSERCPKFMIKRQRKLVWLLDV